MKLQMTCLISSVIFVCTRMQSEFLSSSMETFPATSLISLVIHLLLGDCVHGLFPLVTRGWGFRWPYDKVI